MFCLEKLDLDTRLQLEQSSAPYVISITLSGSECRCNTNELKKVDRVNYSASDYIGKTGIEKYYEKPVVC